MLETYLIAVGKQRKTHTLESVTMNGRVGRQDLLINLSCLFRSSVLSSEYHFWTFQEGVMYLQYLLC